MCALMLRYICCCRDQLEVRAKTWTTGKLQYWITRTISRSGALKGDWSETWIWDGSPRIRRGDAGDVRIQGTAWYWCKIWSNDGRTWRLDRGRKATSWCGDDRCNNRGVGWGQPSFRREDPNSFEGYHGEVLPPSLERSFSGFLVRKDAIKFKVTRKNC